MWTVGAVGLLFKTVHNGGLECHPRLWSPTCVRVLVRSKIGGRERERERERERRKGGRTDTESISVRFYVRGTMKAKGFRFASAS